ncbi:DUF2535 family protein [Rossellomorea sp. BNER]|uniref:DUF2535 family protein n=1 Tax=Rossellomorea sp. BNER TaxID=2962031 RepID=UPI003AF22684|nr:YpmP family protein [Rossellomorea sp. BNER]
MITKSFEFKTKAGQKVKILEIPVLEEDNPLYFKVNTRLQQFIASVNYENSQKKIFCFREYLKRTVKWSEYEQIYQCVKLKNNA